MIGRRKGEFLKDMFYYFKSDLFLPVEILYMKASVDRSKRKETNDPSLDSMDKIPANKMF